jgi:hypothetical protein
MSFFQLPSLLRKNYNQALRGFSGASALVPASFSQPRHWTEAVSQSWERARVNLMTIEGDSCV